MAAVEPRFWHGRRVLVTGHTGFKGAWLCLWLQELGAHVTGLSDAVPTSPSLYDLAEISSGLDDRRADVRDFDAVDRIVAETRPEVVIHMAAQSLVRASFDDPMATYATNVMGSVHVIEASRRAGAAAIVNVTSDKCYENRETGRMFTETDPMGGHDPYSSSKGCAELVTAAFRDSFALPLASGRAGNVIGGGDWSSDRLIPDIMNAALTGAAARIRSPNAVRPWQHVLNPLAGYLMLAERVHAGDDVRSGWNFGPDESDVQTVEWIAGRLSRRWPGGLGTEVAPGPHPHEANHLALDSSKARTELGWSPRWDLDEALRRIVDWYQALSSGADMRSVSLRQLDDFLAV